MALKIKTRTDRWLLAFALVFGTACFIAGIAFALIGVLRCS